MKTRDILTMHAAIERAMADPTPRPAKYAYALARNLRLLEPIVAAQRDALKGDWLKDLEPFERERQELVQRHARRDEAGNPVVLAGGRAVLADHAAFNVDFVELQARHPNAQGAQVRFEERAAELAEVEEEITLFMLQATDLPAEIEVATMHALLPMIAD